MECQICYVTVPVNKSDTCSKSNGFKLLECKHSLCEKCYRRLRTSVCPFCRAPIYDRELPSRIQTRQEEDITIIRVEEHDVEIWIERIERIERIEQLEIDFMFQLSRRQLRIQRRSQQRDRRERNRRRRRRPMSDPTSEYIPSESIPSPITSSSQPDNINDITPISTRESEPDRQQQLVRMNKYNNWSRLNHQNNSRRW
jgi:hypothetical protein